LIHLDDFENRILIAGDTLPTARVVGRELGQSLRQLRSRQAGRVYVTTLRDS